MLRAKKEFWITFIVASLVPVAGLAQTVRYGTAADCRGSDADKQFCANWMAKANQVSRLFDQNLQARAKRWELENKSASLSEINRFHKVLSDHYNRERAKIFQIGSSAYAKTKTLDARIVTELELLNYHNGKIRELDQSGKFRSKVTEANRIAANKALRRNSNSPAAPRNGNNTAQGSVNNRSAADSINTASGGYISLAEFKKHFAGLSSGNWVAKENEVLASQRTTMELELNGRVFSECAKELAIEQVDETSGDYAFRAAIVDKGNPILMKAAVPRQGRTAAEPAIYANGFRECQRKAREELRWTCSSSALKWASVNTRECTDVKSLAFENGNTAVSPFSINNRNGNVSGKVAFCVPAENGGEAGLKCETVAQTEEAPFRTTAQYNALKEQDKAAKVEINLARLQEDDVKAKDRAHELLTEMNQCVAAGDADGIRSVKEDIAALIEETRRTNERYKKSGGLGDDAEEISLGFNEKILAETELEAVLATAKADLESFTDECPANVSSARNNLRRINTKLASVQSSRSSNAYAKREASTLTNSKLMSAYATILACSLQEGGSSNQNSFFTNVATNPQRQMITGLQRFSVASKILQEMRSLKGLNSTGRGQIREMELGLVQNRTEFLAQYGDSMPFRQSYQMLTVGLQNRMAMASRSGDPVAEFDAQIAAQQIPAEIANTIRQVQLRRQQEYIQQMQQARQQMMQQMNPQFAGQMQQQPWGAMPMQNQFSQMNPSMMYGMNGMPVSSMMPQYNPMQQFGGMGMGMGQGLNTGFNIYGGAGLTGSLGMGLGGQFGAGYGAGMGTQIGGFAGPYQTYPGLGAGLGYPNI